MLKNVGDKWSGSVNVTLPGYHTLGVPHMTVTCVVKIVGDDRVAVDCIVQGESGQYVVSMAEMLDAARLKVAAAKRES